MSAKCNDILINASNLHVGGGIQVATSFIYELSLMDADSLNDLHFIVSDEVNEGLIRLGTVTSNFKNYKVVNTYGLHAIYSPVNSIVKYYKTVFTIFGPNYLSCQSNNEIVGFAQLWILEPNNPIKERSNLLTKTKISFKRKLQWLAFKRANTLIVELEHVARKLESNKKYPKEKIHVVYNTVSNLYFDQSKWKNVKIQKSQDQLSIGIISRDYSHKNLAILPQVAILLRSEYNLNVHFYVTLNEDEWSTKDSFFKENISTVGALKIDECPSFYQQMDGIIFPSLLECFSATPLEAMIMQKPLFASDRDFVRDVCFNHALYFDPLDANNIAQVIANYYFDTSDHSQYLKLAKIHAIQFSNAKDRAQDYLNIIRNKN